MKQPLVSVIIPTYNRADKVITAIESVERQVYTNIQLIVIDDGSSDGTGELLRHRPGIEYRYQENAGQAAARSKGLAYAKGELVASLDSDDYWEPLFLEKCVNAMEQYQLDFVFANWNQEHRNGELEDFLSKNSFISPHIKPYTDEQSVDSWIVLPEKELRRLYLSVSPTPSSAAVMRKSSMIGGWNKKLRIGDDWGLFLDIIFKNNGCKAAFTMEKLWYKHVHEQNIFDGRSREDILEALVGDDMELMNMYRAFLTTDEMNVLRKNYVRDTMELAKLAVTKKGNLRMSWDFARRSFREMPFQACKEIVNIFHFAIYYRWTALKKLLINSTPNNRTET